MYADVCAKNNLKYLRWTRIIKMGQMSTSPPPIKYSPAHNTVLVLCLHPFYSCGECYCSMHSLWFTNMGRKETIGFVSNTLCDQLLA